MTNLFIFNSDLRLRDNPALYEASQKGDSLVTIYFNNQKKWISHHESDLKIAFQTHHLVELKKNLENLNITLKVITASGIEDESNKIVEFTKDNDIENIFLNEEYGANEIKRNETLESALKTLNKKLHRFDSSIFNPKSIKTQSDTFFKVFTPYSKAFRSNLFENEIKLCGLPKKQKSQFLGSDQVELFQLDEEKQNILKLYNVGEDYALDRLSKFTERKILDYKDTRDFPAIDGTSSLSPYLSSGIISGRQCLASALKFHSEENIGVKTWVTEIIWREFYKYILFNFPRVSKNLSFSEKYDNFPWENNDNHFKAWTNGETGVPIIDAAMTQLNKTGWMHNRLRMIVAMYLTKNLLIDWRKGEKYFMKNLIDGDFASNNGGWQWSASTGVDAAPYFRIFNPITQSEKFDKDGIFIKKWLPKLSPLEKVHDPLPEERIKIGYSQHLVDLKESRKKAIESFSSFSN